MNDDISKIIASIQNVRGWLSPLEAVALYNLARNCTKSGSIVEIGTWEGKSTICIAKGSIDGNKTRIYTIDPHTFGSDYEVLKLNLQDAKVNDVVFPIVAFSQDIALSFTEQVELLFIDGEHKYSTVTRDFEAWYELVVEGGTIAFHDTILWPGPRKFVDKFIYKSEHFKNIRLIDSLTIAEKVAQNSPQDRRRNIMLLWKKRACVFYKFLHLFVTDPNGFFTEIRLHRKYG